MQVEEKDARLLAVLLEQVASPDANAVASVETDGGDWTVLLLWCQGPNRYATRIATVERGKPSRADDLDRMARDIGLFLIEEPHGPHGRLDNEGRYWID